MIKKIGNLTLIGTSHVAKESILQIKEFVELENPQIIAIELDRRRAYGLLTKGNNPNIFYIAKKIGLGGLLFYLIGQFIQNKIGKILNIQPGSDMLTALKLAEKKKLKFALIDRDIEITLKRLGKNLTWKDKKNFVIDLFGSIFKRNPNFKIDLSKVPPDDLILNVIKIIKERYPGTYRTLILERNIIMANRLINIMNSYKSNILAVVGAGHVEGICKIIQKHNA